MKLVSIGLIAAGLGIGIAGVQPGDPMITGGELGPLDRVLAAWSTGLVLPLWLLYVQHGLNEALGRMNPVTEAEEQYGAFSGDEKQSARIRERLREHYSANERSEELDIVPWVTAVVAAICTAVFVWQVATFGFALSLKDMEHSGAASIGRAVGWRARLKKALKVGKSAVGRANSASFRPYFSTKGATLARLAG